MGGACQPPRAPHLLSAGLCGQVPVVEDVTAPPAPAPRLPARAIGLPAPSPGDCYRPAARGGLATCTGPPGCQGLPSPSPWSPPALPWPPWRSCSSSFLSSQHLAPAFWVPVTSMCFTQEEVKEERKAPATLTTACPRSYWPVVGLLDREVSQDRAGLAAYL